MRRWIGVWLLACSACVWIVLVTGGVTRLTHSGLSIVEWRPVTGTLPPLSHAAWEAEFEKYRATPEYLKVNADAGMTLEGFQAIYLMEYSHRLLARAAGLVFAVPFFWFAFRKRIESSLLPRLGVVALLWAAQGALGWFMVASGLVNEPRVSHYRLTAHLLTACVLYAVMLSTAMALLRPGEGQPRRRPWLTAASRLLVGLSFLTIASGGLVAGLRAGLAFNTFPKIGNYWVPPYLLELRPAWLNLFENKLTVQFDHRVLAALLAATALAAWAAGLRSRLPRRAMASLHLLAAAAAVQFALGALTLVYRVPVVLGAAHQGFALILLASALLVLHESSVVSE